MGKIIIYVAGNPDGYPLEYFDPKTGTFQGVIPQLLEEFSERTDYDVRYYAAGKTDMRQQLADNLQVDLISACMEMETFLHKKDGEIILLETVAEGQKRSFGFYLSQTAPEILKDDLNSFLSGTTWETKTGLLLEEAERRPMSYGRKTKPEAMVLFLLLAAFISVIVLLIRKRKIRQTSSWKRAEIDKLTGIGNTDYFMRMGNCYVNDKNRILYQMVYFYIDLESVERTRGRQKAEGFLKHMAAVLSKKVAATDIMARICDDGIGVLRLSPGEQEIKEWLLPVMRRIYSYFGDSFLEQTNDVAVGIYKLKAQDHDLNEVVAYGAKIAQAACQERVKYKIGTDTWLASFMEERKLLEDMELGFEKEEFDLYIQCCVEPKGRRIAGGQALSRWEHPEKGFLLPGRYIPLMEREGMISRHDYYLLEKVCIFLEQLQNMGIKDFPVFCILSDKTLEENNFMDRCIQIIVKHKFPRKMLIVRVTKHQNNSNIKVLKDLGIQIITEVFRSGFSHLLEGREQLVDGLLLDKDILDSAKTAAGHTVLKHMIQTGHELGMRIWAKGVEGEEQAKQLNEMGCDILQGFYFHYPVQEQEIKRVLTVEEAYET